jgi:HEAT repeat protein
MEDRLELDTLRSEIERKRRELLVPFGRLLGEPANGLARVLIDSDPGTRLMARKALEAMGNTRRRQERLQASFASNSISLSSMPDDPLVKTLHATMPQLIRGVTDPDVKIRQATIDVLEMFGDASRPGVPALVQALSDSNHFVRWAAGRTLGKIGPVQEDTAVPGLAKLLEESDLDLRLTAAWALEHFGPSAKAAVPALTKAVARGDPEIRKAVMSTLIAIGKDAESAIPAITAELANPNPGVRMAAAEVLGRFGPAARSAENALKTALEDDDPEVRVAASDALLSIRISPEK